MTSYCTALEDLQVSDPVCLVPGQPGRVAKATADNLLLARAVLGVALRAARVGEVFTVGDSGVMSVATWNPAGRVSGEGRLLVARDGACVRDAAPEAGDYTIGLVGGEGALTIQRDYELSLATHRMINVRDFGAVGDGVIDDSAAFTAALAALPPYPFACAGTVVFIPPGEYRLSRDFDVHREVHLLGAGGWAGNARVILRFDEGRGIVVHGHGDSPQQGQQAQGCLIEGLRIMGQPPRGVTGGVRQSGLPARWQPETEYQVGDRVCMYRPETDGMIQGYRYFYWECIRAGLSAASPPDIWTIPGSAVVSWFAAHRGHVIDRSTEWQPDTAYRTGQVVRPANRFDVIYVKAVESTGHTSGAAEPDWGPAEVRDNGIVWLRREAGPYIVEEGPGGPA